MDMKRFSNHIEKDVYDWLTPEESVGKRNLPGGTAPEMVKKSLQKAGKELAS